MAGIDSYTKLLLHFNDNDGDTSTEDATSRHGTINFNGTAKIIAAKFGEGCAFFNGSSSYLTVPAHNDWDLVGSNSDNWTVELFVKYNTVQQTYFIQQYEDLDNKWEIANNVYNGKTYLHFGAYSGGTSFVTMNNYQAGVDKGIADTNWHHLALIKVADKYALYLDGTQQTYTQDSDTDTFSGGLQIGRHGFGTSYMNGMLDEIRIIKSNPYSASPNAGLTDTITPPTNPHTSDSNTHLLLHLDSDYTDSGNTEHTVTNNNAIINEHCKFGRGGLLLDGDSDYLTVPDSSDWDIFDTGVTATVDTWIKFDALTDNEAILGQYADDNNRWYIYAYGSGGKFVFDVYGKFGAGGDAYLNAVTAISTDTDWHHLAFVRISGTTMGLYLDGNQIGYLSDSSSGTIASDLYIGQRGKVGEEFYFDGHIDELRIQYSNYFNASPNSEKTDTIAVPTREYNYEVPHAQTIIII